MNFWECFYNLCQKEKTKPNIVAKELNISSASVTGWKKGSPPNSERLCAIADYFGVSTDYLLGRSGPDPDLPEDEKKLLSNYRKAGSAGRESIQRIAENEARLSEQDPEKLGKIS